MRKLIVTLLLATSTASIATAADLPAKPAPQPVAAQSLWTSGFYAGVNAGVGYGTNKQDISQGRWEGDDYPAVKGNSTNILLGGQAGYNHFVNNVLIGVEADAAYSTYKNVISGAPYYDFTSPDYSQAAVGQQVRLASTLRARAGYVFEKTLVYVTGGLALTNGDVTLKDGEDHTTGYTHNLTAYGWAAGVGAEYAIDKNWSVKTEYLHINTRGRSHTYSSAEDEYYSSKDTFTNDIMRMGVNYRF